MSDTNTAGAGPDAAAAAAAASSAAGAAAPAAGAAPTPGDAAAAAAATAAAAAVAPAATEPGAIDTTGWPAAAVAAYEKARGDAVKYQREAGDQRINAKKGAADQARADLLATLTEALNPGAAAAGAAPTIESLTAELAARGESSTAAEKQVALVQAAWNAGINPTKLGYLQYQLSTDAGFKALDPTAADFADKLSATIAAQVAKDSTLKLPGGAVASGVENLGGASGEASITPEAFAAMSVMERTTLYKTDKATYDKLVGAAK